MKLRICLVAGVLPLLLAACAATPKPAASVAAAAQPAAVVLPLEEQRAAILAMAGEYRVTFDFRETVALKPGYTLHENHESDANEAVIVLENSPRRIVLQHILVDNRGHVTKHWRQDWEYEQTRLWAYGGDYGWSRRQLAPEQVKGQWVQTVWQVDDSPRYAGVGRWVKENGVTHWTSDRTWRPLPRREHTERSDYDVLVVTNRHTLTPDGWVHEQDNDKLDRKSGQVLARELGINSYHKVKDVDFQPGYDYWNKTRDYWAAVREVWAEAFAGNPQLALRQPANNDEDSHFMAFVKQASDISPKGLSHAELVQAARATLSRYLVKGSANGGAVVAAK